MLSNIFKHGVRLSSTIAAAAHTLPIHVPIALGVTGLAGAFYFGVDKYPFSNDPFADETIVPKFGATMGLLASGTAFGTSAFMFADRILKSPAPRAAFVVSGLAVCALQIAFVGHITVDGVKNKYLKTMSYLANASVCAVSLLPFTRSIFETKPLPYKCFAIGTAVAGCIAFYGIFTAGKFQPKQIEIEEYVTCGALVTSVTTGAFVSRANAFGLITSNVITLCCMANAIRLNGQRLKSEMDSAGEYKMITHSLPIQFNIILASVMALFCFGAF